MSSNDTEKALFAQFVTLGEEPARTLTGTGF